MSLTINNKECGEILRALPENVIKQYYAPSLRDRVNQLAMGLIYFLGNLNYGLFVRGLTITASIPTAFMWGFLGILGSIFVQACLSSAREVPPSTENFIQRTFRAMSS